MRTFASIAARGLAGLALAATLSMPALAQSDGGGYAGTVVDPVTGMRCITPSCDAVVTQDNKCICRNNTPNATKISEVSLTCTTGPANGNEQCTPPRFGN